MVSTRLPLTTGGALVPLVSAILLFSTLVAGDAVLYSYTNPVCNGTTPQGRTVPIGQCVTFGSGQYARVLCQNGGWTLSVYDSSICPSSSQLWSINGDSATQCRDKSGDTSYKVNCEAANTRTSIHTTTSWSKGDCTGTGNPGSIYTAGACMVSGTNTTRRWHCNEDGSKVYRATYSDNTCTTIDSVVEYRASSTATQGCYRSTSYMCKNAELGPSVPYEFPIENFYETTSFYNSTKLDSAKVCFLDAYPVIQTSRQVTKIGKCDASTSRGTSESIVCSAPGGYRASVTYNDLTCQSPIYAKVQSTGCSGGSMGRCLSAAQLNFQLPTQGYIDYDGNNCTADSEKSATFVVAGGCIRDGGDSFKMQCNTDAASGITSAVVTTYDDQLCSGTVKSTKTYVADGTMCVPNRYDSGNLRRKYQCGFQAAAAGYIPSDARNFDTTGDNSATVIGQSTFGLIAAILIGMIAASL